MDDPYEITEGDIDEAMAVEARLPEFTHKTPRARYLEKLSGRPSLILIARIGGDLAGFKVAVATSDTELYSWLGGVLPPHRRRGIAQALLTAQEDHARAQGYETIFVRTKNRFPAMLHLLIANGYLIRGLLDRGDLMNHKIELVKAL